MTTMIRRFTHPTYKMVLQLIKIIKDNGCGGSTLKKMSRTR